jgi:hypothetical protein
MRTYHFKLIKIFVPSNAIFFTLGKQRLLDVLYKKVLKGDVDAAELWFGFVDEMPKN